MGDKSCDLEEIVEHVYNYLTMHAYPVEWNENKKRTIRKKAKKFFVSDGELFYIQNKSKIRFVKVLSLLHSRMYCSYT